MSNVEINLSQISVQLDQQDKQLISEINKLLARGGVAAYLLSTLHVYSWANMENGLLVVGTEDWNQLAKAITGINKIVLLTIQQLIVGRLMRIQLSGTPDQRRFWSNYESVVVSALRSK